MPLSRNSETFFFLLESFLGEVRRWTGETEPARARKTLRGTNVGVHVAFYIEPFIPKLVPGKDTLRVRRRGTPSFDTPVVTGLGEGARQKIRPHRNRFLEVQTEIRGSMASDKKTLLPEANASVKRNLISVGGCADTPVDVDATGNADGKRPCLGNGQTEGHGWGRFVGGTWMRASRRISGQ
jgi:hypothetical protein